MSNKNAELNPISASHGKYEVNSNETSDGGAPDGIYKVLQGDRNLSSIEVNVDTGSLDESHSRTRDAGPSIDMSSSTPELSLPKIGGKKKSVNFIDDTLITENTSKSKKKKGKKKSKGKHKNTSISMSLEKEEQTPSLLSVRKEDTVTEFATTGTSSQEDSKDGNMDVTPQTMVSLDLKASHNEKLELEEDDKDMDVVLTADIGIDDQVYASEEEAPTKVYMDTQTIITTEEIRADCKVIEQVERTIILSPCEKESEDEISAKELSTTALLEEITQTINTFSEIHAQEEQNYLEIDNPHPTIEEEVSVEIIKQTSFDIPTFKKMEVPENACDTKERNVESTGKTVHFELDIGKDNISFKNDAISNTDEVEIDMNLTHDLSIGNQNDEECLVIENAEEEVNYHESSSSSSSSEDGREEQFKNKKMKKRKRRSFLSGINFHLPKFGSKKKKDITVGKSDLNTIGLESSEYASNEFINDETISGTIDSEPLKTHENKNLDLSTALSAEVKGQIEFNNAAVTDDICDGNSPSADSCLDVSYSKTVETNPNDDSLTNNVSLGEADVMVMNDIITEGNIQLNDKCVSSQCNKVESPGQIQIQETEVELQVGSEMLKEQNRDLEASFEISPNEEDKGIEEIERTKKKKMGILASLGIHMSGFSGKKKGQNIEDSEVKMGDTRIDSGLDGNPSMFDASFQVDLDLDNKCTDTNQSDSEKLLASGVKSLPTEIMDIDTPDSTNLSVEIGQAKSCEGEIDLSGDTDDQVNVVADVNLDEEDGGIYPRSKNQKKGRFGGFHLHMPKFNKKKSHSNLGHKEQEAELKNDIKVEFTSNEELELKGNKNSEDNNTEACDDNGSNIQGEVHLGTVGIDVGITSNQEHLDNSLRKCNNEDNISVNEKDVLTVTCENSYEFQEGKDSQISGIEYATSNPSVSLDTGITTKSNDVDPTIAFKAEHDNIIMEGNLDGNDINLDDLKNAACPDIGGRGRIATTSSSSSEDEVLSNGKKKRKKGKKSKKKTKKDSKGIFGISFHMPTSSEKKEKHLESGSPVLSSDANINGKLVKDNDFATEVSIKEELTIGTDMKLEGIETQVNLMKKGQKQPDEVVFEGSMELNDNKVGNIQFVNFDVDQNNEKTNVSADLESPSAKTNINEEFDHAVDSNVDLNVTEGSFGDRCIEVHMNTTRNNDICNDNGTSCPTSFSKDFDVENPIDIGAAIPSAGIVIDELNENDQTIDITEHPREELDVTNVLSGNLIVEAGLTLSSDVSVDTKKDSKSVSSRDEDEKSPKPIKKRKKIFGNVGIQFPKFGSKKNKFRELARTENPEVKAGIHESKAGGNKPSSDLATDDTDMEVKFPGKSSPSLGVDFVYPEEKGEGSTEFYIDTDSQPKPLSCIPEEIDLKVENDLSSSSNDDSSEHEDEQMKKGKKKGFFGGIHLPSFSWKRNKGSVYSESLPISPPSENVSVEISTEGGHIYDNNLSSIESALEETAGTYVPTDKTEAKAHIDADTLRLGDELFVKKELDTPDFEEKDSTIQNTEDLNVMSDFKSGLTLSCQNEVANSPDQDEDSGEQAGLTLSCQNEVANSPDQDEDSGEQAGKVQVRKKKGLKSGINLSFPRFGERKKKGSLDIDSAIRSSPDIDIVTDDETVHGQMNINVGSRFDTSISQEMKIDSIVASAEVPEIDSHLQTKELDICNAESNANIPSDISEIMTIQDTAGDMNIGIEGQFGEVKQEMEIEPATENKMNDVMELNVEAQFPSHVIDDTDKHENKEFIIDTRGIAVALDNNLKLALKAENLPTAEIEGISVSHSASDNILIDNVPCGIIKVSSSEFDKSSSAEIGLEQPCIQENIDLVVKENEATSNSDLNLGLYNIIDVEKKTSMELNNVDLSIDVKNTVSFDNDHDLKIGIPHSCSTEGMVSGHVNDCSDISISNENDNLNLKAGMGDVDDGDQFQYPPRIKQPTGFGSMSQKECVQQSDKSATLPQTRQELSQSGVSIEGSVKKRLHKGSSEPELSSRKLKKRKKRFTLLSFNFHMPNFWSRRNKDMKEDDIDVGSEHLRRPKSMEIISSSTGDDYGAEFEPKATLASSMSNDKSVLPSSSSIHIKSSGSLPDISGEGSLQVNNTECEGVNSAADNDLHESIGSIENTGVVKPKSKKKMKIPSFSFQFEKRSTKKGNIEKQERNLNLDHDEELQGVVDDKQNPVIPVRKLDVHAEIDISDVTLNGSSALELTSLKILPSIDDNHVDAIKVNPEVEVSERNCLNSLNTNTPVHGNVHGEVNACIVAPHKSLKVKISGIDDNTDVNLDLPSPASDSGLSSGVGDDVNIPGFKISPELAVTSEIGSLPQIDASADVSTMGTSNQADEDSKRLGSIPCLSDKHRKKGLLSPLRLPKISFSGKRKSRTLPAVVTPSGTVQIHNSSQSSDDSIPRLGKGKKRKNLQGSKKGQTDQDESTSFLESTANPNGQLEISGKVSFDSDDGPSTSTPLKNVHQNNSNALGSVSPLEFVDESEVLPIEFTTTYKVVVAIDFGSTFSGYAYCFPINSEQIFMMRKWQGGDPGVRNAKMPSTLLLTPEGDFHSFGYKARDFYHDMEHKEAQKWLYFDKFKMTLHANQNLDLDTEIEAANGINVPAVRLFELALAFFRDRALEEVYDHSDHQVDLQDIRWVLTVPAIWKQQAKQFMRKAAYLAGIASTHNPDQLTIALEPEAASIYIRQLKKCEPEKNVRRSIIEVEDMNTSVNAVPENLSEGCRYIVVDCGGGTVDITVHQIEDYRGLVEVHKASGGTFGSISVDRQFQQLLVDIFGQDFIDEFKIKRPAGWVDLMIAFEARKRNVNPWKNNPLNVSLPFSFIDYYKKFTGTSTVEHALKVYNSEHVKWSAQGMMRFTSEGMKSLFQPSINSILGCIDQVLNQPNIGHISHLFIVGGFAESSLVQNMIQKHYQDHLQVIIPHDITLAVVKGAVMYGMDPTVIRVRKSKLTYGVGVLNKFDAQKHPLEKKVVREEIVWCTDIFDKFVEVNQAIQTGEKVCRSYRPAKPNQEEILISIYCSEKEDVKFITDRGVKKFGNLKIDLTTIPQLSEWKQREIKLTMQYGDTEIKISALDVLTGHCVKANIDFQNE
ncbi:uncharacterized protein LOC117118871 isoform X2 [Anneissia japonica]|uniref:uncharacterized protein LOC117118871 isoform X2 n=1 Tax=Anneissia japonica TaxID=1529436 RepID=UPI0014256F6E|nr:uncharacterized protein LOC117118871 isoform X2 [Anneissia japonica]